MNVLMQPPSNCKKPTDECADVDSSELQADQQPGEEALPPPNACVSVLGSYRIGMKSHAPSHCNQNASEPKPGFEPEQATVRCHICPRLVNLAWVSTGGCSTTQFYSQYQQYY
jgi:hypothetical protein